MRLTFIPRPRLPGKNLRRRIWQRRQYSDDERQRGRARQPLYRRLVNAWYETPTKWYPLPLGVGSLLLVGLQWRKRQDTKEVTLEHGEEVVRLKGPWQVHVLGALPLRSASRLWGWINSFELPVWIRPYCYNLYAWIYNCNLDELDEPDLRKYLSLGDFFYRKLKPGARPIADAPLVSPADGTILHFGSITDHKKVEQVKGITYSLDALLGVSSGSRDPSHEIPFSNRDHEYVEDSEFANVNGIPYTVDQLLGHRAGREPDVAKQAGPSVDESVGDSGMSNSVAVALEMGGAAAAGVRPSLSRSPSQPAIDKVKEGNQLYFAVIYLAPGDYHRFHSPTAWVVEKRRHFAGELYSVAPYVAKRLQNLFVLNERVVLLGRWRHGFFSMIPVGATNVGSIVINFDQALRTNQRRRPPPPGVFTEGVYKNASSLLGGQPLAPGVEVGGFKLGSTIVLVFEAPSNFEFNVKAGEHVSVGQSLGTIG